MTAYRDTGEVAHVMQLDSDWISLCGESQGQFVPSNPDLIRFVEGDDGQPLSPWCPRCADVIRGRIGYWTRDVLDHTDTP